jgi:hypothetical protein
MLDHCLDLSSFHGKPVLRWSIGVPAMPFAILDLVLLALCITPA